MIKIFIEMIKFLIKRNKYFLIPILIGFFVFALAFIAAKGSAVAPFIYTIF
jgi:hypothetical protein